MANNEDNIPKTKKPANTAFKQQRLKAWQPLLTPKTVLPTLFLVGIIFAPIGGLLLYGSSTVSELVIDYTSCLDGTAGEFRSIPSSSFKHTFVLSGNSPGVNPRYKHEPYIPPPERNPAGIPVERCTIQFDLPVTLKAPVFLYYKLTNFYQNHRRYVKSLDLNQLKGEALSAAALQKSCQPIDVSPEGLPYYPCGLIANSMFNDTYSDFNRTSGPVTGATYVFKQENIAWPSDRTRYGKTNYGPDNCRPPPNWASRYPGGKYTAETLFDVTRDEHFQVWIRTAPFPSFRKLYGRNDAEDMQAGTYSVDIDFNYDVTKYGATKSIVISTTNVLGGRNSFLGGIYLAVGLICVILGVAFTVRHCIKPRKLGDHSLLTWNTTTTAPVQFIDQKERKSLFKRNRGD
ncbi:uncharacterized protein VTP21DRAFT_170 [Calcarisporiella thermophila]|uniref:uncharacterized protein n=1 Tax=Calcarisporiella thermophila TaxID=911321 RepID=UPI003743392B